jgi:hypothetical protein
MGIDGDSRLSDLQIAVSTQHEVHHYGGTDNL